MLSIGHIHIQREELTSFSFVEDGLTLAFEWPAADLPVLLQLPRHPALRFHHLGNHCPGLPLTVTGWRCVPIHDGCNLAVRVRFTMDRARH